ncbi:hypothetical protein P168DRAFT_324563 [Aspergillus campestris IBT 28561]|uniref:DUF7721 domain-containing protein n=1 Tax=Aspergillus campestris (strain IBT 28561) TaxID=1392248 RepID=A0A2I1DB85_ASPC2|nr:uncharacterized protein P168DRAFT_324563 [Aspergillus campestris IBT 28561]PKY07120.1 hypothetical protein P168DRAFT_324563 [Aspergillus campestris IBT 28561]
MDFLHDAIKKHTSSGGNGNDSDDEFNPALSHAQSSDPNDSTSRELFSQALQFIKSRKSSYQDTSSYDIDESHMVQSHQALYGGSGESASYYQGGDMGEQYGGSHQQQGGGGGGHNDSDSLGAGAAMQALKMFTSGGGSSSEGGGGGGSMDKNAFIGMAMAQAGRLWEEKNSSGGVSGDKQSAVNKAAEMALKMYMKSNGGGLGGTGGPSGLLSLAGKFLK